MSNIHYIVDRLNEPPFAMQLSLVAFDEKSPFELLEIVNSVMRDISPAHATNLRDETPEATANRMMDFLFKILNYKQVGGLTAALSRAQRSGWPSAQWMPSLAAIAYAFPEP